MNLVTVALCLERGSFTELFSYMVLSLCLACKSCSSFFSSLYWNTSQIRHIGLHSQYIVGRCVGRCVWLNMERQCWWLPGSSGTSRSGCDFSGGAGGRGVAWEHDGCETHDWCPHFRPRLRTGKRKWLLIIILHIQNGYHNVTQVENKVLEVYTLWELVALHKIALRLSHALPTL